MRRRLWAVPLLALGLPATPGRGQELEERKPLTLKQAQEYALAHHPDVQAADLRTRAAEQGIRESRAAFFPQVLGVATAVAAGDATRIAASGGLNNPSVFQRESNGLLVSQLITDFGRTSNLTASSRYLAESAARGAEAVRARVLLGVNRAFFGVLGARALLRVADQTVEARELVLDRVSALAKAQLKSGLDVSFADVNLKQATLLRLRAQDRLETGFAELAAALGLPRHQVLGLAEEPIFPAPPDSVDELIKAALAGRPELLAVRAAREAAEKRAAAEKAELFPVLAAIGGVGFSPYRDNRLQETYATAGLNLVLPLFTGGRLQARAEEASLQARAAAKVSDEEESQIEKDVRIAWLEARTAFKAMEVTQSLLESASRALELAESRYNLGISSIVELSQAQLQKTEAEIANTTARYDYQYARANLDFQVGTLH
jgi:outer membrane protein